MCVCGGGGGGRCLKVELKTVKLKDIFHLHYSIYLVPQSFHLSGLPGLEHFLSLPICRLAATSSAFYQEGGWYREQKAKQTR